MTLAMLMTTVGSKDEAARLARQVVDEKRAACVQIIEIESVYNWEGVRQDREWRLDMKTTERGAKTLMERVLALHPYDEPEVIVLPIGLASLGYAAWVEKEVPGGT